jgi:hypothetical protein
MPLPTLRIKFTDEVYGANLQGPLRFALESHFSLEESDDPQIVFYGEGKGRDYRRHPSATRIYVAVENRYPDFAECDYAMTFLFLDDPRHLRVPMYVFDSDLPALLRKHEIAEGVISERRDFCAFVVSNASKRADRRLHFFHKLNAARPVNSGGRTLNNVGGPVADKPAFLRRHRFNLCFENHFWPGYTTEKIAHALAAGCIPIYWGNSAVAADFNPESFINVSDYGSDEAAVEHILTVADSEEMQLRYLRAPSFSGEQPSQSYDLERMAAFFKRAVETPRRKRPMFSPMASLFRIRRQFRLY